MTTALVDSTPRRSEASGREFALLITALMATMAIAIDLLLPAFPAMRQAFGMADDATEVSLVVTAYFLGMAFGPWLYGPASDRFGRRPPMLAGLIVYLVAGVAAALAPTWPLLVASRFLWGLGAAGPRTLTQAMVRDRFEGDAMAHFMSNITAVFLLVPVLAPTIGAGLIAVLPWRAVLWTPALLAAVLIVWSRRLPETLPPERRRPFTWSAVGVAAREVLRNRQAFLLTIGMTLLFGSLTAYLTSSEVILDDVYDLGSWFPLFFGAIAVLLAANSLNNARMVSRVGAERLARRLAVGMMAAGVLLAVVAVATDGRPPFWLFMLCLCIMLPIAQGLAPTANALAMAPLPHVAGTAASIMATATIAGGSLLGGLVSSAFDGTVRPYALFSVVYLCAAGLCTLAALRQTPAAGSVDIVGN